MAIDYVALGDSYAAGAGAGDPGPDNPCLRSRGAYPVQVAAALGVDLAMQACQGATVADVVAGQLGPLAPGVTLVTVTAGGNDLGFAHVLTECAKPAWMGDSDPVIDAALTVLREDVPRRLVDLYGRVRRAAPDARLVVAGYPRLFAGEDCNLLTFFSDHEMTRLNDAADELAGVIGAAAEQAGAEFVDVRTVFEGHAVCQKPEWIRGVSHPIEVSFHPTTPGHDAYARLVLERLGRPEVPEPAREPRVVQGAPTGVRTRFELPDLLGEESLHGARRSGLDPDEVAALARAAPDDHAARQRLNDLDAHVRSRAHARD
ncbi:SGNH/GDSL hydrolase family protein [Luteipulveratus sp. YIM 133132]|uniref:SGNH/GDSL hydrolase family protein n=1 Tax=Luteipulveratus flavus TaxID=3031728 RepID=UPI0023AF21C9|nr:SGNH/GDSL hydrolase family protein [Luteipulveratus sp. YIM 133132]MDE9364829.1 SGNH/GDSL hydrolase family protein [Luteipulveratus sp. YIM 133132]